MNKYLVVFEPYHIDNILVLQCDTPHEAIIRARRMWGLTDDADSKMKCYDFNSLSDGWSFYL